MDRQVDSQTRTHWHIVTGEYPPQPGGVSDYTRLVASGLAAAGDLVDVWTPSDDQVHEEQRGVVVHALPDRYGPRSLTALTRRLRTAPRPRRVLVQYVPHAFGWKGANVAFSAWLRALAPEPTWVMFHEVAYPRSHDQTWRRRALGYVTHGMAALVAGAAERVFVSTPAWTAQVRQWCRPGTPITWLPVPSAVPVRTGNHAEIQRAVGQGRPIVGHFGTCGALITPGLFDALHQIAQRTEARFLLFGRGTDLAASRAVREWPALAGRLVAAGTLTPAEISRHLAACDVMLQPFPDGVTGRRTSVMAALAHGRPVVTTAGRLTEPLWQTSQAVRLAPAGDASALAAEVITLLDDPAEARRVARDARATYEQWFDLRHTIAALRAPEQMLTAQHTTADHSPLDPVPAATSNTAAVETRPVGRRSQISSCLYLSHRS